MSLLDPGRSRIQAVWTQNTEKNEKIHTCTHHYLYCIL